VAEWGTSQDKAPGNGSIRVKFEDASVNTPGTVTVFRDGKAIATRDAYINGGSAEFKSLPLGTYEVRSDCPGWKTVVKRAILTDTDRSADLMVKMLPGNGTLAYGVGESLHELEARIQKLEAAVAKLQGK
jgi:hypothetical protein